MKKIKIGITGCLGRMGQELIKAANKDKKNSYFLTNREQKI